MVYGLWLSAAGMAANQYRQDVAANNLANIETIGFKHDLALLSERPVESREDGDTILHRHALLDLLSGGTRVTPTVHSFEQGPAQVTNQPLDAMIQGSGFFQVETADGPRYTRDGRFAVDPAGRLVTVAGALPVLDQAGQPITVAAGQRPEIDHRGRIKQGETVAATLGVVEFDDLAKLRKQGASLFVATGDAAARSATSSQVVPRTLEGSTIDPITGLVGMIEASRAFEINANMISLQDSTMGRAANDIARF